MLTVKQIEAAQYGSSPQRLSDGNGLYVRLSKGGSKTFQLRVTRSGRSEWISLGRYPDMSLRDARMRAALKRAEILDHEAPRSARPEAVPELPGSASQVPLLRDFAKIWFDRKKQGLSNGKHIQQNWTTLETYVFPQLGRMRLDEIKQRHIIAVFDPIWREKHETAKRTLGRLREVFELARLLEHVEVNPADFKQQIAFGRVIRRPRHQPALDWPRAPELWKWLVACDVEEDLRHLMMTMVLSGKRTREVRFLEWKDIDLKARIWTSQSEHMKRRREHRVPISEQLAVVFENMRLLNGDQRCVFARPRNKSGVLDENSALRMFKQFDPAITGHGMRTTLRTWMRKTTSYPFDVMETALSHEKDKLVQAYMRDDLLEERRPLMQEWADYLTGGAMPAKLRDRL